MRSLLLFSHLIIFVGERPLFRRPYQLDTQSLAYADLDVKFETSRL
jgi:hypothetical protein